MAIYCQLSLLCFHNHGQYKCYSYCEWQIILFKYVVILLYLTEKDETTVSWYVDLVALLSLSGQNKCILVNDG